MQIYIDNEIQKLGSLCSASDVACAASEARVRRQREALAKLNRSGIGVAGMVLLGLLSNRMRFRAGPDVFAEGP